MVFPPVAVYGAFYDISNPILRLSSGIRAALSLAVIFVKVDDFIPQTVRQSTDTPRRERL